MSRGRETKIKVCGLTRPKEAAFAAGLGAWALGVVFVPGSPRCITVARAKRIKEALPGAVKLVGVFMDESLDRIQEIRENVGLDLVQLHGSESRNDCLQLDESQVIKAVFRPGEGDDFNAAYVLVDRPKQRNAEPRGDTNLELAARLVAGGRKVLLAGGLSAKNVEDAVRKVRPFGVDVASGVEQAPGIKDENKMIAFFDAVRRADGQREDIG